MKTIHRALLTGFIVSFSVSLLRAEPIRSEVHESFIAEVRDAVSQLGYRDWTASVEGIGIGVGPWLGQKTFVSEKPVNGVWPVGTRIVSEHWSGEAHVGTSVFLKQPDGYSVRNRDWYWIQLLADGTVVSASPDNEPFRKPGFLTRVVDGRLWVFTLNSADIAEFIQSGEPAKSVTRPGAGPNGMTIRSSDPETIDAFVASKAGFTAWPSDGRLWVFHNDDPELSAFLSGQEPAQIVVRPGAGPNGVTLKATDGDTLTAYSLVKDGFTTFLVDGRVWVFKAGAEEIAEFQKSGELAKHVIRPGAGPGGLTLKAPDADTITAYLVARAGFETMLVDGRLWVFRSGAEVIAEFKKNGELAQHVTRPGAGPDNITLKGPDAETLDAYLN